MVVVCKVLVWYCVVLCCVALGRTPRKPTRQPSRLCPSTCFFFFFLEAGDGEVEDASVQRVGQSAFLSPTLVVGLQGGGAALLLCGGSRGRLLLSFRRRGDVWFEAAASRVGVPGIVCGGWFPGVACGGPAAVGEASGVVRCGLQAGRQQLDDAVKFICSQTSDGGVVRGSAVPLGAGPCGGAAVPIGQVLIELNDASEEVEREPVPAVGGDS